MPEMQGTQKTELRGVYRYTLSGSVCSVTQHMSVFQHPHLDNFLDLHVSFTYKPHNG
ncbi:MAG: hypothetical protein ACLPSL_11400 [Smithella sp.]